MLDEFTENLYRYITENGIDQIIFKLEEYSSSQKETFLRAGDYKLAKNWKEVNNALFSARREAMIRQLN